ncbi:MAG: RNA 2',3'-cyclic phosphodiesterase [Candidatus Omnitrophota bacterium]
MRTFIAVDVSKEIRETLGRIGTKLRASGADVKWVDPQNLHLTLKFLGDIDLGKVEEIKEILSQMAKNYPAFRMVVTNLGAFPKASYPRVIWVGIDQGKDELLKISRELEKRLENLGIKKEERAMSCHITIGRVRSPLNRIHLIKQMELFKDPLNLDCTVDKIILYKSTLSRSGPIYEAVHESALA